jgi:hypothetical protein
MGEQIHGALEEPHEHSLQHNIEKDLVEIFYEMVFEESKNVS